MMQDFPGDLHVNGVPWFKRRRERGQTGLKTSHYKSLACNLRWDYAAQGTTASFYRLLMMLAVAYRPLVFQEIDGIVDAGEGVFQSTLEPDLHRTGPSNIGQRHFASPSTPTEHPDHNIASQPQRFKVSRPGS
jgi:hypothetical protein